MNICPRTGQPCSFPKQFTVTEITAQGMREIQCCQNCVTNQQGFTAIPFKPGMLPVLPNPIHGLHQLMAKLNPKFAQQGPAVPPTMLKKCPGCGANQMDIEKSGRFGCPQCYATFKKDIETMLGEQQGAIKHTGKVPKAWKARQEAKEGNSSVDRAVLTVKRHPQVPPEERIKLLEEKMKMCVKVEDYERAALIRDVIKEMKTFFSQTTVSPLSAEVPSGIPEDVSSTDSTTS